MDPSLKDLEEAEVQKYVKQFQHLDPKQLQKMLHEATQFTPTQEQDLPLQKALVILLEQADPAPQEDPMVALDTFLAEWEPEEYKRPRPRKRLLIVAAVLAALLGLTAVAYAVQHWSLFLNIQEKFTQPRLDPGPEVVVETWTELPIPTVTPKGFFISDAASGDGTSTIEYSNSEGQQFSIFYYSTESSVHIDSEEIDQSTQFILAGMTVYLLEKDGLSTLFWNCGPTIVSVEFHPEEVSLDEIKALAESMALPI